jgi:hypothetical protein
VGQSQVLAHVQGRRLPDSSKMFARRWAGGSPAIS